MNNIVYWSKDETTLFAVEELRRLSIKAGHPPAIHSDENLEKDSNNTYINLILTDDYNGIVASGKQLIIKADGFVYLQEGSDQWIIGNEPRAILYGVYTYLRKNYGYRFINFEEETYSDEYIDPLPSQYVHEPMFTRRGNVIETINDPVYLKELIDWGTKNGHNEYFFTVFLWDEMKPYLEPELRKRGLNVTLGGHSLSYLLSLVQAEQNSEVLEQDEKLKFFAEDTVLQDKIINKIVRKCMNEKIITRISLWPEDIGIDEKDAKGFIKTYIRFTERLKESLQDAHLSVEVEHIVYNAGLSWDMLEREEDTNASDAVDVLYAYWGRDYSSSITSSDNNQQRAFSSLKDWHKESAHKGRSLTVFEYYSDHFMLSELFPPLINRIRRDLNDYLKLNITGVLNLIVPLHKKNIFKEIDDYYPWKWVHHLNNYIYARLSFGEPFETIISDYFDQFEEDKAFFFRSISQIEELISKHTKWNASLFPARVVDPEKVATDQSNTQVKSYLAEVDEYLSNFDFSKIEPLLSIQRADNSASFSAREMYLIYFYYLKKVSELYGQEWD